MLADSDLCGTTEDFPTDFDQSPVPAAPCFAEVTNSRELDRIGRYRIERVLGKGGFGIVYLAHDEQLGRPVALKIPHDSLITQPETVAAYLTEARTVANLDHPHIVPVHDVGSTDECPCFIVSKYIEGIDLAARQKTSRLTSTEAAELIATVAEALHYAHKQGLVHRDVKPGNILIDVDGSPWLVDFGLALRQEDTGSAKRYAGTAAYMSPEQARGEGHRVDGRSDIFSLGAVFYELLTGRRAFVGDSRAEVLKHVTNYDPWPLRQYDENLPPELGRICRKALAKRASERYLSAHDFADDLRHFLAELTTASSITKIENAPTTSSQSTPVTSVPGSDSATQSLPSSTDSMASWKDNPTVRIIPKGLRSFDAHDADFYLDLLPGPRDRNGLPDCVRFWKLRIEESDPNNTFPVGLIYGPSGCGKSSLVKAGLLPLLSRDIDTVYLEATPEETESRLLHLVRKRCPDLESNLGLRETLAAVRNGRGIPRGKKLLIVIDQFEQWLHGHQDVESTELVRALRQCDGGRLQCIVTVRDEFWLAVTRLMRELEIKLVDGHNTAVVDQFDQHHARKVLAAFGVAYGKIHDSADQITREQQEFLKRAVAGLANEGRVICVRLALFADMMQGKPWTTAGLHRVGGAMGVGETFLEDTFSASTASPKHRCHQTATRAVLKALLPESGTDIKGEMKSRDELLRVSGYAGRSRDFDELLRILDSELRLISPVDMEGVETDIASASSPVTGRKYYQLTHDYLVHSIRDWLTRKQRETRRGRAEIRLAERSALWNDRPETRQLLAWWEYLSIRFFTDSKQWSGQERKLVTTAGRHHAVRMGGLVAFLVVLAIAFWQIFSSLHTRQVQAERELQEQTAINRAVALVHQLSEAKTESVPGIIAELNLWRPWAAPLLEESFQHAPDGSKNKLHVALALVESDEDYVDYLAERLPGLEETQFRAVREALQPFRESVGQTLWHSLDESPLDPTALLPTARALASYSPDDVRWERIAPSVAAQLTKTGEPEEYLHEFAPVSHLLVDPLRQAVHDTSLPRDVRSRAATALCGILSVEQQTAEELPEILIQWILETEEVDEFSRLLRALRPHSYGVQRQLRATLDEPRETGDQRRLANAVAALLYFGDTPHAWRLLRHAPDPSLRSLLIDRLALLGTSHQRLANQLDQQADASVRQAIVLVLGGSKEELPTGDKQSVAQRLERLYVEDRDAGVHSAVSWTLRQWRMESKLQQMDGELSQQQAPTFVEGRDWLVNSVGQTYVRITRPTKFLMGDASESGALQPAHIDCDFAMAVHEVTVAEFHEFRSEHEHDSNFAPDSNCPANNVSWYDAVAFCNWLSDKEGLPCCYEPNAASEYAAGVRIPDDFFQRTGYRLPTEAEWEYFCRAGANSTYSFGHSTSLLGKHAWHAGNSMNRTWPVGSKLPNLWGAFDTHGNLWEWCQDLEQISDRAADRVAIDQNSRLLCGGAFDNADSRVQTDDRLVHFPHEYKYSYGFRPIRTLPAVER